MDQAIAVAVLALIFSFAILVAFLGVRLRDCQDRHIKQLEKTVRWQGYATELSNENKKLRKELIKKTTSWTIIG